MKQSASKSRMLLLELLLCVFIFSFCVIICAGIFFHGSNVATQSRDLTYCVQVAQAAAEAFKTTDDMEEFNWLMDGMRDNEKITVQYDANWNVVERGGAYVLGIAVDHSNGVSRASITIGDYSLTVYKLTPEVTP